MSNSSKRFNLNVISTIYSSVSLLLVLTVILGGLYPLSITLIAKLAFPQQANGSLIVRDGKVIGSKLLGQFFTDDKYFWGRLSENNYDSTNSAGTNLSIAHPKLLERANARVEALQKADPDNKDKIPVGLVTASASGLDPDISLLAAQYQVSRVAKARGMKPEELSEFVKKHIEPQSMLTEKPYVNVLELNMALDEMSK